MLKIKRYCSYESRIVSLEYIIEYSIKNGFKIPDSQREKEWLNDQNHNFIKSILENKPLGSFIFNKINNNLYVLDGQHRINALELFVKKNNIVKIIDNDNNVNYLKFTDLSDNRRDMFLNTEIFIREYEHLSNDEMADIINSINGGIKNDKYNKKSNNIDETMNMQNLIDNTSMIVFEKKFIDINIVDQNNVKKFIAYIGLILNNFKNDINVDNFNINNFDNFDNINDTYIQLDSRHITRFYNNDNINIANIYNFIIMCNEIIKIIDLFELNNYYINCILYKINEYCILKCIKNNNLLQNIIEELIKDYKFNNFKELIVQFDILYNLYL
jgi:hypothetical protein